MLHSTNHSAEFKGTVALAAIFGVKTLLELASEHKIHPIQITRWKHEVIDNSAELFGKCTKKEVNHNPEVA